MKYFIAPIFALQAFFLVFAPSVCAQAAQPAIKAKFKEYLARVEAEKLHGAEIGVFASDFEGREFFSYNSKKLMTPASVQKVLTSVAALRQLGSNYRFPTEIFVDSPPAENDPRAEVMTAGLKKTEWKAGNIYVRGYGDPSMTSERLFELVQQIHAYGIHAVENIIIDDGLFADPPSAGGPKPYEAALSATALNNNCYRITVAPGSSASPAFVGLTPGAPYQLQNKVRTMQGYRKDLKITQSPLSETVTQGLKPVKDGQFYLIGPAAVTITVSGFIGVESEPAVYYQSVPEPARYYGEVLRYLLEKEGITTSGKVLRGTTPGNAKLLLVFESKPLSEILIELNHYSSNFLAGQVLYALGQDSSGLFRRDVALSKMASVLEKLGYKPDEFKLLDASGLDRENKLSPEQLVKVLVDTYNDFTIAPDFIASLSRFSATGTLKNRALLPIKNQQLPAGGGRLNKKSLASSVWAKTGTLDGVSSIAGYLTRERNERLAFAIITNGQVEKDSAIEIEDELIKLLIGLN